MFEVYMKMFKNRLEKGLEETDTKYPELKII